MVQPSQTNHIFNLILSQYGFEAETITFLQHSGCITYRVGDRQDNEYVFRAHSSISGSMIGLWQEPSIINSEMIWLDHLHSASNRFQKPILTQEGSWVARHDDESENRIFCTLLEWVEGECPRDRLTFEEAQQAATLLAHLHDASEKWIPPSDFVRPSYDEEHLLMAISVAQAHKKAGKIPAEDFDAISICVKYIVAAISDLGKSTSRWGMIHGDFVPSNIVFQNGHPIPIDFAECGYGHYLLDVGRCLLHLGKERAIFFKTCTSYRRLPENPDRVVEEFCIANIIYWLAFTASLPDRYEKVAGIVKTSAFPAASDL